MTTPGHELHPADDEAHQVFIEAAAQEAGLEANHPLVLTIADARYRAAHLERALIAAEETIYQKNQELEALIYDRNTGVLLYDPAVKMGNLLLDEIKRNLNNPEIAEPHAPNALMAVGVDVEALHIINNRWGSPMGDAAIGAAADTLVDAADFLNTTFRTQERREAIWRRGEVPRHTDIIARRKKGDELFALVAFHETAGTPRSKMQAMTEERFKTARRPNGKRLYLHTSIDFYDPARDQSIEDLLERVDPKTTSRGERAIRFWRKIGRAAVGRY